MMNSIGLAPLLATRAGKTATKINGTMFQGNRWISSLSPYQRIIQKPVPTFQCREFYRFDKQRSRRCFSTVASQVSDQHHHGFGLYSPSTPSSFPDRIRHGLVRKGDAQRLLDRENDIIRTIPDFVRRIPRAVQRRKANKIVPGSCTDPVAKLFRQSDLLIDDWSPYAHFDTNKPYTRNLIATDHKTYTLLLLCWNPNQESPIHDHPCDGCWLKVLQGDIHEVRYNRNLQCTSDMRFGSGALSYITDQEGYHKVGNPTSQRAVTLHLYAPPFESCHCWRSPDDPPDRPVEGRNINHSEYGKVLT